jgi:hypothetical protein
MVGVLGNFVGSSTVSALGEQPAKRRAMKRHFILDSLKNNYFEI